MIVAGGRARGEGGGVRLLDGEPELGPWRVASLDELVAVLREATRQVTRRPAVVAVDGHSSSGKTSLTRRLAPQISGAAIVHTDDVAWFESAFDWAGLLTEGVLEPVRRGEPVHFRPPAWEARGREGAIEVPAGIRLLLIEGVGSGRRALTPLLDAVIYVQCDAEVGRRRDAARVDAGEISTESYAAWMAEEDPFVIAERTWERAVAIVNGSPTLPHDADDDVVLGQTPISKGSWA
jgi:hypothetical protein